MKKSFPALALLLTVGAYCLPGCSPAEESAPESGGAALLEEAKSWLTDRGERLLNSARDEILVVWSGLDGAAPGTLAVVNGHAVIAPAGGSPV